MNRWSNSIVLSAFLMTACGETAVEPEAGSAPAAAEQPVEDQPEAAPAAEEAPAEKSEPAPIEADWSQGVALTKEALVSMCSFKVEVMADADGNAPTEGFTADGTVALTSGAGALEQSIKGSWSLDGGAFKVTAKEQIINGNGDVISDKDVSATYANAMVYGDVLVGERDGKLYATKDCGVASWQESKQIGWNESVVQVIDATGGADQVKAAVTALKGAGAVVVPGTAAKNPRTGAQILTRAEGGQDALKAALEKGGFSPVEVKAWAEAPAPVVVAVGPNGS